LILKEIIPNGAVADSLDAKGCRFSNSQIVSGLATQETITRTRDQEARIILERVLLKGDGAAHDVVEIALKIDVDTNRGLGEGVPRLAQMLAAEGISATFFVAMGPDNSGRAIWRALKNPGFISKMRRTRAASMYGWRTILSGTVLPARPIALAYPQTLRDLLAMGFELGVHGYDHVRWQDHIDDLSEPEMRAEIDNGLKVYRAVTGSPALSFAAPGWRTNNVALKMLDARGLVYHSDTRGQTPYRCSADGEILRAPEIPTTLPTLDEVMGTNGLETRDAIVRYYLEQFSDGKLNVHTIHAETEGMSQLDTFTAIVRGLIERGARFVQLRQIAEHLSTAPLPVCEVTRTTLPGRAGWISAQGRHSAPLSQGENRGEGHYGAAAPGPGKP
jgi:undecaprenyl phosphate-alpha-L-ara4FN deformylase